MSYRSADVPSTTRKCGIWESEITALKMGLFMMNAVVGAVSSGTTEGGGGGLTEVTLGLKHNTTQYSTVQYSTAQYSTAQPASKHTGFTTSLVLSSLLIFSCPLR